MSLNSTEEIIEEIRAGRMVILMDDEDRENEGDLVMAASHVRPEDINFMASHGRGLICLTVTRERCEQLDLPLMVQSNESLHATNFTLSIEAATGVTTGISAQDRAQTVLAACAPDATSADIVQPGHIFPLMAQRGGVLTRAGHTEAGCDLARLAGLEPAAVIVEILKEDGSMARKPDLEVYAKEHGLKMGMWSGWQKANWPLSTEISGCMPTMIPSTEPRTWRWSWERSNRKIRCWCVCRCKIHSVTWLISSWKVSTGHCDRHCNGSRRKVPVWW
jgi:3,4-dihydroxy-2-butanone 4-phosphate synthase